MTDKRTIYVPVHCPWSDVELNAFLYYTLCFYSFLIAGLFPGAICAANQCVTHATCNTTTNPTKCQCKTGYTASPTAKPTMCKFKLNGIKDSY